LRRNQRERIFGAGSKGAHSSLDKNNLYSTKL